jgi:hypothetical protein
MDFYPPNRSSVSAYRWRIINRILAKWMRRAKFWSLLAVMTLPLSITKMHA